jgi:hypothetical protein
MKQFFVGVLVTIILSAGLFSLYQTPQAEGAEIPAPEIAPAVDAVAADPVVAPLESAGTELQTLPEPAVAVETTGATADPLLSAAAAGTVYQPQGNGYGQQQTANTTPGTPQVQAQTHMTTPFVATGTIQAVELTGLSLLTSVGEPLWVQLGPSHFWSTQGVTFSIGDEVTIDGFVENDQVQASSVTNDSTGQQLTLRDETGRPLWAGGAGNAGSGGSGYRGGQG